MERVNRELEGVVDVKVEWSGGDLHGRVGEHVVQCKVTRLASAIHPDNRDGDEAMTQDEDGNDVIVQCFQIPFTIEDTNECELSSGHVMHHRCVGPAICVNTIGSYECLCPKLGDLGLSFDGVADETFFVNAAQQDRGPWEVSVGRSSESSCPSSASTHGCCAGFAHSKEGQICRSDFRCPVDPCVSGNQSDCDASAQCIRADTPLSKPQYICHCPHGLMGNGHRCRKGIDIEPKPMVKFDGVTPTEETLKNNYYCGCTHPQVDACEGFPACGGKFTGVIDHSSCLTRSYSFPLIFQRQPRDLCRDFWKHPNL